MRLVNVYEARGQFSKLLEQAEAGEEIVVARNGKPIVRLVPVTPPGRLLGRWSGKVKPPSDAAWEASDRAITRLFAKSVRKARKA